MEKHGEPIPGSRYHRCFCARCGEPMRCPEADLKRKHYCEECGPPHMGLGGRSASPDDTSPAWENAVRALEG